ncbi:MAG: carboxy-S-adenosyl-L-methionine synthase CmoA [Thiothrix sp.]|nr:carboxy-S-adenosyl-L-methionine synthase CmoA [Thiothrix sp.]HPQ95720.1 carboxy-S-adenosyl-L-methionine synthase CmoA [Thiolinea sp.]
MSTDKRNGNPRDALFAHPQPVVDFAFNAAVADVFPDMVRRSIPGYETIISQLGVLARRYVRPQTRVYDLGCSLGAATLSMASQVREPGVRWIGVDNSQAMIDRCALRFARHLPPGSFTLECADISRLSLMPASLMVLNFTLQFIPPPERQALLNRVYAALLPGGALVLSEKTCFADAGQQALINELYLEFKRANGYSELEISQKRSALEKVMIPETLAIHRERLQQAGFTPVVCWFQSFSFLSLLALKAE